ncbi:MAG TPA: site-specific integrase, partial [Candidatus Saccharimonadales bacterium]|nr:site-specific integrase [Candidatus Saccharimonadales bacterium]
MRLQGAPRDGERLQLTRQAGAFLAYLRDQRNCSGATVRAYASDLEQFSAYLRERSPSLLRQPSKIDPLTVRAFLGWLHEQGESRTSIARKLSCVKSFFKYMVREGRLPENPARPVRAPRQERKLPRLLGEREVELLLETPEAASLKGIRDRAILELLYATGMRVGEMVALDLDSLDLAEMSILVRGKGRKERQVLFGARAKEAVLRWLAARRAAK